MWRGGLEGKQVEIIGKVRMVRRLRLGIDFEKEKSGGRFWREAIQAVVFTFFYFVIVDGAALQYIEQAGLSSIGSHRLCLQSFRIRGRRMHRRGSGGLFWVGTNAFEVYPCQILDLEALGVTNLSHAYNHSIQYHFQA